MVPVVVGALLLAVAGCSSSVGSNSSTSSLMSAAHDEAPGTSGSAATSGSAIRATFRVDPASTMMDEPVGISLAGLPAGKQVTVTAQSTDVDGTGWKSSAQFTATPSGIVSLAQPSTGGSYRGRNAMALFELMVPPSSSQAQVFRAPQVKSFPVVFQATADGTPVAQVTSAGTHT